MRSPLLACLLVLLLASPAAAVPMRVLFIGGGALRDLTIGFRHSGPQSLTPHGAKLWGISGGRDAVATAAVLEQARVEFGLPDGQDGSDCQTSFFCEPFPVDGFTADADPAPWPGPGSAAQESHPSLPSRTPRSASQR